MKDENLKIYRHPKFVLPGSPPQGVPGTYGQPRLVMGFSGWMDGGDVSTGTIRYLRDALGAEAFAHIEPELFYIYNFPGSMEISALFRPHTRVRDGLIEAFEPATNTFYCSEKNGLVLFSGKEPNLAWRQYADRIFSLADKFDVRRIYFIGSVAGLTPHTREPRFSCSMSDEKLKEQLTHPAIKFSNYEGPAGIITYLTHRASDEGVEMLSLVAEIPAYVQGYNPRCVESATRLIASLLGLKIPLDDLRRAGDDFEKRLTEIVAEQPELAEKVSELEADYDNQVFDTEMGDLKEWLEQKGIRLD